MLSPPARRSPTCTGRCGDTGALGSIGTSEKCAEVVVYTVEGGPRGHMPAAPQAPGVDEVGEELSRPREDSPGGEEYVILGGEARPVGEAQEGNMPETETIQNVLDPEGVSVAFGGGPGLRASTRLSNQVRSVQAVV